jgi:hypothetical protein
MEQIVILALFVLASIVSSVIQNRKKRQEAEEMARQEPREQGPAQRREAAPPFQEWPQTAGDWKRELRKLLEEPGAETPPVFAPPLVSRPAPPPVISQNKPAAPPVVVAAPRWKRPPAPAGASEGELALESRLNISDAARSRASALHERVRERMAEMARSTGTHRHQTFEVAHPLSPLAAKFRHRQAARDAFIASLIFSAPVGLQSPDAAGTRPAV